MKLRTTYCCFSLFLSASFILYLSRVSLQEFLGQPLDSRLNNRGVSTPESIIYPEHNKRLERKNVTIVEYKVESLFSRPIFRRKRYNSPDKLIWQSVGDSKDTRVLSAFLDTVTYDYNGNPMRNRKKTRNNQKKETYIRIIAVAKVNNSEPDVGCLLWYSNDPCAIKVSSYFDITGAGIRQYNNFTYQPIIISCKLPRGYEREPEEVSVIRASDTIGVLNLLKIHIPEVMKEPMEFGHCMSVAYSYHDLYHQVEWIEILRYLGVKEFNIYKLLLNKDSEAIYSNYSKHGILSMIDIDVPIQSVEDTPDEASILLNMSPVLNDCMYRNMYRLTIGECNDNGSIVYVLEKSNSDISFTNVYYFTDINKTLEVDSNLWFLRTLTYLNHVTPSKFGDSSKSIINPRRCIGLQNHYCWKKLDEKDKTINAQLRFASNRHYKKCHLDSFFQQKGLCNKSFLNITTDKSIMKFKRFLINLVVPVLSNLALIDVE